MVIYQGCLLLLLLISFFLPSLFMLYTFSIPVKHHGAAEMWKNLHDEAKKNCFRSFTLKMCRKTKDLFAQNHFLLVFFNVFYHFKMHQYHQGFSSLPFFDHLSECPETNKMIFYTLNSASRNYIFGLFLTLQIIRCRWIFSLHISSVKNLRLWG